MSYQDFTFDAALEKLEINWFVQKEAPSEYKQFFPEFEAKREFVSSFVFQEDFQLGVEEYSATAVHTEEFLKTYFIWPFLKEVLKHHRDLRIWHGVRLDADPGKNLTGEPDYLVTKKSKIPKGPYCIIAQAKRMDFEQGWGQALSAMKGAQILNQRESSLRIPIYGVVTTGILWQFGKIADDRFAHFPSTYINVLEKEENPGEVLGILDMIFAQSEKSAT